MTSTYLDRLQGIETSVAIKAPALVATTANITLSGEQTIDGVAVVSGDRVLVKDQTSAIDNGIWEVSTGTWSRSEDFNGPRDAVMGTRAFVVSGTANGNREWMLTTVSPEIGVTDLAFIEFGSTADADAAAASAAAAAASASSIAARFYDTEADFLAATIPSGVEHVFVGTTGGEMVGYKREPGAAGPDDLHHPDGSDWAKATLTEADLLGAVTDAITAAEFIDYEAGTFSPTLTFATPGNLSVTYPVNGQYGSYVRVGNLVTFQIYLTAITVSHTTGSGAVLIAGLPLTPSALSRGMASIRTSIGIDWRDAGSGSPAVVCGLIRPSQTWIVMQIIPANAAAFDLPASRISTGAGAVTLNLVGSYEV